MYVYLMVCVLSMKMGIVQMPEGAQVPMDSTVADRQVEVAKLAMGTTKQAKAQEWAEGVKRRAQDRHQMAACRLRELKLCPPPGLYAELRPCDETVRVVE